MVAHTRTPSHVTQHDHHRRALVDCTHANASHQKQHAQQQHAQRQAEHRRGGGIEAIAHALSTASHDAFGKPAMTAARGQT